ncbi:hypothetical protein [Desulfatitalea tepidiphila]|nr:hypothetical protein [Desulfatitalea tepidiphila]
MAFDWTPMRAARRRPSFLDIDRFLKLIALIGTTCFEMILDWVGL